MSIDRNTLFFGDNLEVLRDHIGDGSVDLVYLDPPFNSNRDYNVLFKEQSGADSPAQIKAFGDTWRWANAAPDWARFTELGPGQTATYEEFRHGGVVRVLHRAYPNRLW